MEKKILAKNPDPKKRGVNISEEKYTPIRDAIVKALTDQPELTFQELLTVVENQLAGNFDGSINWYTTNVKLDLEARKVIERVPDTKPHRLRLVK
jgi:hypothetical protein